MKKLCFALLLLFSLNAVKADDEITKAETRKLTVTAKSTIKASPDMAVLRFAINSTEKTAEKARAANEVAAANVLNSIRKLNVADNQIIMENLNIYENREWNESSKRSELKGYRAERRYKVNYYNLDKTAELVSAISVNGSNEFNGIEYKLKNPESLELKALEEAVFKAKNKADRMLKNLNESTGKVLEIEELSDTNIIYPRMEKMAMAASIPVADNNAYASGEIEVEASVRAVFSIGQ